MKQQQDQLSPKDWQMLSEYLDGQLTPRDQARLEQRLHEQAELREALDGLRQTRAVLRSVRLQRVPRNFTLTPAMVQQSRPRPLLRWVPVLNFASAAAALAVVVILAVQLLPGAQPAMPAAAPAAQENTTSAPLLAQPAERQSTPAMIIQWGGASAGGAPLYATGKGGGGGGGGSDAPIVPQPGSAFEIPQPTGQAADNQSQVAEPTTPPSSAMGAQLAPTPTLVAPEMAIPNLTAPTEVPIQPPEAPRTSLGAEPSPEAMKPLQGSGPILGAQPPQEAETKNQSQIQAQAQQHPAAPQTSRLPWVVPVALAALAVAAAIISLLIRRKAGL